MLYTCWKEPYQRHTDYNTNYDGTPKYVVDVLGGAVSKTYRRLPGIRNHLHVITQVSRTQVVTAGAA